MSYKTKTIFALSTPPGKSAIALIRISGPDSYRCVKKLSSNMPKKPNTSSFNKLQTIGGDIIDQAVTTYFKAPKSYTGEDMVELAVHGGNAVVKKIIGLLNKETHLRMASPGEFTRKAFENNKLDLTQVEAISDIVNAETEIQRKQAISHLTGSFYKKTRHLFESLKNILANIEAFIDFSEEDLPKNLLSDIKEQIENIIINIKDLLKGSSIGMSIRDGFLVAILGKPNTGKSSFINLISGKDIAIVTEKPGTTRDLIESFIDIDGYPIRFVDTAGIRKSSNYVEKIGIKKAKAISEEASINLVFIDSKSDIINLKDIKKAIFIRSKQDISKKNYKDKGFFNISSKTNYGVEKILKLILSKIRQNQPNEKYYISRERHLNCLNSCLAHLESSKKEKNMDMMAEDIRLSVKSLSSLFGTIDIEDILDIIFSDFCIGK